MARAITSRPLTALWVAIALQLVGRLIDLQWHLTHDDFEGAEDQIRAHLVLWLGVVATVWVCSLIVARSAARNAGYLLVLAGAALYVPVSVWHFIEHANGTDPELAHVLLGVGQLTMVIGAVVATILSRVDRLDATYGQ